ncbi:hypothetical protein NGM10_08145 [Halorussus salilacus]|uniref:hypothetical protein n=1 Tax=Halorussus salilacus TaxID=2953750 RepID=UPI00209CEEF1|nr:hypothetical protein [Halorussus salilacus]USZ66715.1 hypothetical protein NGM10_08145 [Halorussus salilacus]
MSSRDPDKLRAELKSVDFGGDPKLLSELRSEARETVDVQKETLADIDTKASRILRLNVLLIGVIVSALSITTRNGDSGTTWFGVDSLANVYTTLGIGSLVLSTALAATTYTASELDVGVNSDNLTTLLRADLPTQEAQELLVKNYIVRINFNRSTNIRNIPLITSTVVFVVFGIVFLSLGAFEAFLRPVPWWLSLPSFLLLFGLIWVSGLIKQTRRAIEDLREWR